jgi:hypothetical protein
MVPGGLLRHAVRGTVRVTVRGCPRDEAEGWRVRTRRGSGSYKVPGTSRVGAILEMCKHQPY